MAKKVGVSWDKQHYGNIEAHARKIHDLYLALVQQASVMGVSVTVNPDKPFRFSDYPQLKGWADKAIRSFSSNMQTVIEEGNRNEWLLACKKNDEMVSALASATKLTKKQLSGYFSQNLEALSAFQGRKVNGLGLSDRVWKYSKQFKSEIEMGLDVGLGQGKSAADLSRDLRGYLQDPNKLFRRVRDKRGNLQLSKNAANFNPGQGTYRSSYKNAMRLTRTETNMAYRSSDHERWKQLDFVLGIDVNLSGNHPVSDICDHLKGRYPKQFKFAGWHPHCRCNCTPVLASQDDFIAQQQRILDGDESGAQYDGEIKDLPDNFGKWIRDNKNRIASAQNLPNFLKDNAGIVPKIPQLDTKAANAADLTRIFADYDKLFPEDFGGKYKEIVRFYRPEDKDGITMMYAKHEGEIGLNDYDILLASGEILNPYQTILRSLNKIAEKQSLDFNEEYMVESLYHEVLHKKAKGFSNLKLHNAGDFKRTAMEVVNQFVARHDYPVFIERLGGKAAHSKEVLTLGHGYRYWVKSLRDLIKASGANEKSILDELRPILLDGKYDQIDRELSDIIRRITKTKFSDDYILSSIQDGGARLKTLLERARKNTAL
ncbi:MAG: hypothetical protein WC833_08710 [Bacteroidales bacterium]|jgi:hypothetical protein